MQKKGWRSVVLAGLTSVGLLNSGCASGPFPFSKEWYEERANDPPGSRQVDSHGRLWPPYPRPVGRSQTKVHAYHYAHYWPYPHNCEDRNFVENILTAQAGIGWVDATTLQDYHFNPETNQLTEGGRDHLIWISRSVPSQYRVAYLDQSASKETDRTRIEAAEQFYRDMEISDPPIIIARVDDSVGRPAVEVDRIRQLEINSIPKPRLFYIGSATAGTLPGGGVPGGAGGAVGGAGATTTTSGTGR